MQNISLLRNLSQLSAAVLAMHVVLLAVHYSIGSFMFIAAPHWFGTVVKFLTITGILTLAVFSLATQFYLRAKRKGEGKGEGK